MKVLVLNCGSSSLKYQLINMETDEEKDTILEQLANMFNSGATNYGYEYDLEMLLRIGVISIEELSKHDSFAQIKIDDITKSHFSKLKLKEVNDEVYSNIEKALELAGQVFDSEYEKQYLNYGGETYFYPISHMKLCTDEYTEVTQGLMNKGIACCFGEGIMCHEVGHLILDLYARGEVPEEFEEINIKCQNNLKRRSRLVNELLGAYRDDTYDNLIEGRDSVMDFYDNNPNEKELYFIEYPDRNEDDLKEEMMEEHYALISATNENIDNYNRVANIIDAVFHGDNPFWEKYGNDDIDPILALHSDEYFERGDFGPKVLGFEEQFADYLVLRTFPEEMEEANQVLHDLLGDEWFLMMDKYYDKVTSRISDKGKVYQYK